MVIAPIKELKDGSAISAKCHELDEPIHITKNGYSDMVIMSSETFDRYDQLVRQLARRELKRQQELEEIADDFHASFAEYQKGTCEDAFEVLSELEG